MKEIVLETEGILVGANEVGDQIFVRRAVIKNFDVLGGLNENFWMAGGERRRAEEAEKR